MKRLAFFVTLAMCALTACESDPGRKPGYQMGADEQRAGSNTAYNANAAENVDHAATGHGNMNTAGAVASAPDAASAPFDLQFIDSMEQHHRSALHMAQMAEGHIENAELRAMVEEMAREQQGEIDEMRRMREMWYPGRPSALNLELPGMESEKHMGGMQMETMRSTEGANADLRFIEMMIPHHEGAVTLAKLALERAEHAEIKTMAEKMIRDQQAEIAKMRSMQQQRRQ